MPEIVMDGFRFSEWSYGRRLFIVESNRLSECVQYIGEHHVTELHISPYHGYHLDELDFLDDCRHVKYIHLQRGFLNMEALYRLPKLEVLSAIFSHKICFASLPSLTDLSTDWNPAIHESLLKSKKLRRLWMRFFKPKDRSFLQLSLLKGLESIDIIQAPITSVKGIQELRNLRKLGLSYCSKLEDISSMSGLTLEELEFDHCKSAMNLSVIENLKRLRRLRISACGNIPSLIFIEKLPEIEFLSFVNTNILDGDLTPCFKLKYAGFLNKRHYSHTYEDIRQAIEITTNGNSLYPKA